MEVIIKKTASVYIILETEIYPNFVNLYVLICTLNLFTLMIRLSRMIKMHVTYHTFIDNLISIIPMVIIQIDIDRSDKRKIEA